MKRKGFTLIELLAVIVILAVIALIATPLIMNVINDAKKNSFKDSAYGIVKAIEMKVATVQINNTDGQNIGYKVDVKGDGIDYEGDRPDSGWASVDVNGEVTLYMVRGDWCAYKDSTTNGNVEITTTLSTCTSNITTISEDETLATLTANGSEGGSSSSSFGGTYVVNTDSSQNYKGILYLDPTNLGATCNATLASQNMQGDHYVCNDDWPWDDCTKANDKVIPGTKSGCMRWYAFGDDGNGNPTKAILGHNTTPIAIYDFQNLRAAEDGREEDQYEASWWFKQDTANWDNSLQVRMPLYEDFESELNADDYVSWLSWGIHEGAYPDESPIYSYHSDSAGEMQYDYTVGFWTNTFYEDDVERVYDLYSGMIFSDYPTTASLGVRPVITIDPSWLN